MDHFEGIAERLMGVQIENRDAFYVIPHMDSATTLTYLDPPYVPATRTSNHQYSFELTTAQHEQLAAVAHALEGYCVLSGYPSELYADLYEIHGWKRVETTVRINNSRLAREKHTAPRLYGCLLGPLQRSLRVNFSASSLTSRGQRCERP